MNDVAQTNGLEPVVDDGFHVVDRDTANWVVRKIIEARSYAARVETWAAAELRRAKREEEFFLTRYGAELERWTRAQLAAENARRKSITLPAGTAGFRAQPARLFISDEGAVLEWCRRNLPAAIAVRENLLKEVLREHVEATGECPDRVTIDRAAEMFYVR